MKIFPLLICTLLLSRSVFGEDTPAWGVGTPRKIADWTSTGILTAQVGADVIQMWKAPNRKQAFGRGLLRYGVSIGLSEITKRMVHRERPDRSDNLSFWSEHTAIAAASRGFSINVNIPLGMGVGYLRMAADKHHPTDVATGGLVGSIINAVFP